MTGPSGPVGPSGPSGPTPGGRDRWRRAGGRARLTPAPTVAVVSLTRVPAGRSVLVRVAIRNSAPAPRVITVTALGLDADWLPQPIAVGPMPAGAETHVELVFNPPPGALTGRYPFTIAAQALDPAGGAVDPITGTGDAVLFVDEPSRLVVGLDPAQLSGFRRRTAKLTVANSGDRPAVVELTAESSSALAVTFAQQYLQLQPNEQVATRATVRIRRARIVGRRSRHPFIVSARTDGAAERITGAMVARPVFGGGVTGVIALVAIAALWIALGVVALGRINEHYNKNTSPNLALSQTQTVTPSAGGGAGGGGSGGAGNGGSGGGGAGGGGSGGSGGAAAAAASGVRFAGSVAGSAAGGVTVQLAPTSLVDAQAAQSGQSQQPAARSSAGVVLASSDAIGKLSQSAVLLSTVAPVSADLSTQTSDDGAFAFPPVSAPAYYVLTFSKPGYQTQRFVQQAVSGAQPQPMKVTLVAGSGSLSGHVTGPGGGGIGNATITITDGTNTLTTSTNSTTDPGGWSVSGLSTPSSYLVTAVADGLGAQSGLVSLDAGGTGTLDLALQQGVAAISGVITGPTAGGSVQGLGGITVTATSGSLTRTTSTVTTAGLAGSYVLPQLPTPGDYTVTIAGAGYQTQTSQVSLAAGQPSATLSTTLIADLAVVQGSVAVIDGGDNTTVPDLSGVGISLSANGQVVYKTLTDADGKFVFTGVTPGAYTVTAERFGNQSQFATVTAVVGAPATVPPFTLPYQDETPATGSIGGRVVDSRSGGQICDATKFTQSCTTYTVTLTGIDLPTATPGADPDTQPANYTATVPVASAFSLPAGGAGLKPGSYTVTVSATGYQPTTTQVAVGQGQQVAMGSVVLFPTGTIKGQIVPAVGTPIGPTCVIAARIGENGNPTSFNCTVSNGAITACSAASPSGSVDAVCALADPMTYNYEIDDLNAASYLVHIVPGDPDYVAPSTDPTLILALGEVRGYDATINRKGRFTVTVLQPDPTTGSLTTVGGAPVTLTPAAGGAGQTQTTPSANSADGTQQKGVVTFTGLDPGSFTFSGKDAAGDLTGSIDATGVTYNQTIPLTMILTKQAEAFAGRVVISVDNSLVGVVGATVAVSGVTGYANSSPITGSVTVLTDANGCFAIQPPGTTAVPPAGCSATMPSAVLSLVTSTATISSTATAAAVAVGQQNYSTDGTILLQASPAGVPITGLRLQLSRNDATDTTSRAGASIQFIATAPGAAGVTISSDGTGALTWHDPALSAGYARPGTYRIQASLAQFDASAIMTVYVAPNGLPYVATDGTTHTGVQTANGPLVLAPYAGLRISVLNTAGAAVPNASVTLDGGAASSVQLTPSAGTNSVLFSSLSTLPTYRVTVRVPGYQFTDIDATATSCTPGGATDSSNIHVAATADETDCSVVLTALGSVSGTLAGQLVALDPSTITALGSSTVSATQCPAAFAGGSTTDCAPDSAAQSFSVLTGADGRFSITGTTSTPGLQPGYWQITATTAGYDTFNEVVKVDASTTPTCVSPTVGTCSTIVVQSTKVALTVSVTAGNGTTPVTNAIVTLTRLGQSTGVTVDQSAGTFTSNAYAFPGVDPTSYSLAVSASGFAPLNISSLTVVLGQATQSYAVKLGASTNTVIGAVFGQQGTSTTALTGATVVLNSDATVSNFTPIVLQDGSQASTTTAADGSYQFSGVPNGTYYVHAKVASDYLSAAKQVSVSGGTIGSATFVLTGITHTVSVQLVSANSFTLGTPTAQLYSGSSCTGAFQTATLAAGTAGASGLPYNGSWPNIAPGDYSISVPTPAGHLAPVTSGQAPSCATVSVSDQESGTDPAAAVFTITERRLSVRVQLSPDTGSNLPSSVVLTAAGLTFPATVQVGATLMMFVTGRSYSVTAAPSGSFPDWPSVTMTVATSTDPSSGTVDITLQENGSIAATVRQDGAPVASAGAATVEYRVDGAGSWTAATGAAFAAGVYTISGLAPGDYDVRASITVSSVTYTAEDDSVAVAAGGQAATTLNIATVGSIDATIDASNVPAGVPLITVSLYASAGANSCVTAGVPVTPLTSAQVSAIGGSTTFGGLAPGTYRVVASYGVSDGNGGTTTISSPCDGSSVVRVTASATAATISITLPAPPAPPSSTPPPSTSPPAPTPSAS